MAKTEFINSSQSTVTSQILSTYLLAFVGQVNKGQLLLRNLGLGLSRVLSLKTDCFMKPLNKKFGLEIKEVINFDIFQDIKSQHDFLD